MTTGEHDRIKNAYDKRKQHIHSQQYSIFHKGNLQQIQERERALLKIISQSLGCSVSDKKVLDIGCGKGGTLLPLLYYGFQSENCFGIDLLEDRIKEARLFLPNMTFANCSAQEIPFKKHSFDLITMFTCLSSVLDDKIRHDICQQAQIMLKENGVILIYDFRVNNPKNKDVKAVTLSELKAYFPEWSCKSQTLTLIPPLARRLGKYSGELCSILSKIPFLRTHRLSCFSKTN